MIQKEQAALLKGRFARREGKTVLTQRFHTAPLKITKTFPYDQDKRLMVYMMDVSPGLMDGDRYLIELLLEPETYVYLTNQSYTKVHPTPTFPAEYNQHITLESAAVLEYFPEPLIPFAGSSLRMKSRFDLAKDAVLLYGDVIAPGRIHSGEQFDYQSLEIGTEIYRDGKLIGWDRYRMQPGEDAFSSAAAFGAYTHMGMLWVIKDGASEHVLPALRERFSRFSSLLIGASSLFDGSVIVRLLGHDSWTLQQAIRELADCCRTLLLGIAPPDVRK